MSAPPPDLEQVRDASQIARRALVLFAVVLVASDESRTETISWLKSESLWDALSPSERTFIAASKPSRRQVANASWRSEALIVLLWALRHVETLPAANEQCDPDLFDTYLPPFAPVSVADFVATAQRRPDAELLAMADTLLQLHWEARDATSHGHPVPRHLDIEILQERHHAINWVIGYEGLPWDDVTTDT